MDSPPDQVTLKRALERDMLIESGQLKLIDPRLNRELTFWQWWLFITGIDLVLALFIYALFKN